MCVCVCDEDKKKEREMEINRYYFFEQTLSAESSIHGCCCIVLQSVRVRYFSYRRVKHFEIVLKVCPIVAVQFSDENDSFGSKIKVDSLATPSM